VGEFVAPRSVIYEPATAPRERTRPAVGLVLSGGGARGAYEIGVLKYLREKLSDLDTRFDVITGSSVGAINGAFLAATAERPRAQVHMLERVWLELSLDELYPVGLKQLRELPRFLLGGVLTDRAPHGAAIGGVVDERRLAEILDTKIPWRGIGENLQRGHLRAFACAATEVATGIATLFVQTASGRVEFAAAPDEVVVHTAIGRAHAMASASIPGLLPAIRIGEQFFVDGSLRHNTPMRPAMRLGAERLLVIGLRPQESVSKLRARQRAQAVTRYPSALFLAGKLLDALMSDKIEEDLARVRRMNELLEAGTRAFGPDFAARLSDAMGRSRPYRPVRTVYIRPSESLGRIAADIVRQQRLSRATNLISRMMRRVVAKDAGDGESDFASFVLFDPAFVEALVDLGYRDAAASHDALVGLFRDE